MKKLITNAHLLALVWSGLCCVDTARAQDAHERLFWESVNCEIEAEVRAYLSEYPEGAFADQAFDCIRDNAGREESEALYQPCAPTKADSTAWAAAPTRSPKLAMISSSSASSFASELVAIVRAALSHTGRIEIVPQDGVEKADTLSLSELRSTGVDSVVSIDARALQGESGEPDTYEVDTRLIDVATEEQVSGFRYSIDRSQSRTLAHQISDTIFENLTGLQVSNLIRRLDVVLDGELYSLIISDYDCDNPFVVTESKVPIGPKVVWNENRSRIAYYVRGDGVKQLYVHSLSTGSITRYSDTAEAPAWVGMVDE